MNRTVSSILLFIALIAATILLDYLFHLFNLAYIGRYLGLAGTLLIMLSFQYSLKKWKIIQSGNAKRLLGYHEVLGWIGALFIMVHGGIHFNAIIPWVAAIAMIIVVASGLTGKYLLQEAKNGLSAKRDELKLQGKGPLEIEREIEMLALMVNTMKKWRKLHMPLTMLFFATALIHIIVTLLFWRW